MKSILLLVLGLVVGALAAAKVSSVVQMRDAYPRGVMSVMQHHLGALAQSVRHNACPVDATQRHLQRLKAMQPDILPAFAENLAGKADFRQHASKLVQAIDTALADPAADCKALGKSVSMIGGTCKSCHQIYR